MWKSTAGSMGMSWEQALGSQGREIFQVSLSLLLPAEPCPESSCCSLGEGAGCSSEPCAQRGAAAHQSCQPGMEREGILQELEFPSGMKNFCCLVGGCEEQAAGLGVQRCLSQLRLNCCLCCPWFPAAEVEERRTVWFWNSQGPLELAGVGLQRF